MSKRSVVDLGLWIACLGLIAPLALSSSQKAKSKTKTKSAASAPAGSATQGKVVFDKNCGVCHLADDTKEKIGPGLKGLFKNKELPKSHKPATEANVREQIAKGSPQAEPMPMPSFAGKLSDQETRDVIAYLKTL